MPLKVSYIMSQSLDSFQVKVQQSQIILTIQKIISIPLYFIILDSVILSTDRPMNLTQEAQFYEINESVDKRSIKTCQVVFSALTTLDLTGKPEKLKEILKLDEIAMNLQKILLVSCNIVSLQQVFGVRHKNKYINLGLEMVFRVKQVKKDIYQNKLYFPKDSNKHITKIKRTNLNQNFLRLKQLYLDNNSIESMDPQIISQMKQLRKLSFYNNYVQLFPSFSNNPNLTSVNGRRNPIKKIMISPSVIYLKQVQMDWLDYIDVRSMQNSNYENTKQKNKSTDKIIQNKLNHQFIKVIMELKRQKYVLEAHTTEKEEEIGFKEFMSTFIKLKKFSSEFEMDFLGYDLRLAMIAEFDIFIDYCKEMGTKVNFNELRYKGNLLLEYALENQYQYGVGLFIEGLRKFKPQCQTIYHTMELACMYSHRDLLQSAYSAVLEMIEQNQRQKPGNCEPNLIFQQNCTLKRLLNLLFEPNPAQSQLQGEPIIGTLLSVDSLPEQRSFQQQGQSFRTKFDHLITQLLLNFSFIKQSDQILKMLMELYQLRQINVSQYQRSMQKLKTNQTKDLQHMKTPFKHRSYISQSQRQQETIRKSQLIIVNGLAVSPGNRQPMFAHNQIQSHSNSFQPKKSILPHDCNFIIDIQTPSESVFRMLTKESVENYIHGLTYIRNDQNMKKHFRIKQEIPYTKSKSLLQIAGSIKNNQLLQDLLWNLNFTVFNRNHSGKLPRTAKVLLANKKLICKKQIQQLRIRFKHVLQKSFSIASPHQPDGLNLLKTIRTQNPALKYSQIVKQQINNFEYGVCQNHSKKLNCPLDREMHFKTSEQRSFLLQNSKKLKQKNPNIKKLKLSRDYHASFPIQIHKDIIQSNQQENCGTKNISVEIQKVREKRDNAIGLYDNINEKQFDDDQTTSLHNQFNRQYELMHEILWESFNLSHLQAKRERDLRSNLVVESRIMKKHLKQKNVSLLNHISKSILQCACVQFQPQLESYNGIQ